MGSIHKQTNQRTGETTYMVRWRTPEGSHRKQGGFKKRPEAKRFLIGKENEVATGDYIDASRGSMTFEKWWKDYRASVHKRPTTWARDESVTERWFLPALGRKRLSAVTPADVRAVIDTMSEKLSPTTVRTDYGVLRAIFAAAVEAELIRRSPCRGVKLPPERRAQPRFLSLAEIHRLADAIGDDHRALVYVAAIVGLRWSECAGLRVRSCDFLRRTISVVETVAEVGGVTMDADVKSHASRRTVTVPKSVMDMLAEHLARRGRPGPDELVWVAPEGGPLRAGNFRTRTWQPACVTAGFGTFIEDKAGRKHYGGLTFHGLRHSAAGLLIELGTHPRVMQQRLGHASIRTTLDVYGSVLPDVDERATQGLTELLDADSCARLAPDSRPSDMEGDAATP